MTMKTLLTGLAMLALLGAFLGSALAQRPASGPEDERMVRMMKMMEQMQDQMKQMPVICSCICFMPVICSCICKCTSR